MKGWKEATFTIPGVGDLSVAVVSGLSNARQLMTDLEEGRVHYDFVEVMACPAAVPAAAVNPSTTARRWPRPWKCPVEHR